MRRLLFILVLVGCEGVGDGFTTMEQAPSAPPPVALVDGTQVVAVWQFRNPCPADRHVDVMRDDLWLTGLTVPPGYTSYVDFRCRIGEQITVFTYEVIGQRQRPQELPCSPGVQPVRAIACQ